MNNSVIKKKKKKKLFEYFITFYFSYNKCIEGEKWKKKKFNHE